MTSILDTIITYDVFSPCLICCCKELVQWQNPHNYPMHYSHMFFMSTMFESWFFFGFIAEEPNQKPHKDIFLKACKLTSSKPKKIIMVGDNLKIDI